MPWSELAAGRRPDPEDVLLAEPSDKRLNQLRDWYSVEVSAVSAHVGRVICQRSNCWWDSKLRRLYRWALIAFALCVLFAVAATALARRATLADFVLGFLAPSVPILLWAIRESRSQAEAADRADRLKVFGDGLWNRLLNGEVTAENAADPSREFQSEILAHRRQSPLVFNWFYKLFRGRFEQQMGASVAVMVREAHERGVA